LAEVSARARGMPVWPSPGNFVATKALRNALGFR